MNKIVEKNAVTVPIVDKLWEMADKSYEFGSPWTKAQFGVDFENPASYYLFLDDPPTAFLSYQQVLDEIELFNVVVAKEYQGQGLARRLLKELFKRAAGEKVATIFLEVRISNHSAQNLYLSLGFDVIARRQNYYHAPIEDALIMQKKVRPNEVNERIDTSR